MLDVHEPHGRMDGIRDFLLHIFTITVGLLIALALEGCVERYHKAELRKEAEANLRKEIKENQGQIRGSDATIKLEEKRLRGALAFLAARKKGQTTAIDLNSLAFENRALSDASWRTATATGALTLMNYEQVQQYAGAYLIQDEWQRLEEQTLNDYLEMESFVVTGFDPATFGAAEAIAAEPVVRHAMSHLEAMREVGEALVEKYDMALKEK